MARNLLGDDVVVGVVGTGAMGRGIAQVTAVGGMTVLLYDAADGAAEEARKFISAMLSRAVEKGRMEAADAEAATARLQVVTALSEFAAADAVVEAIVEKLDIKQALFRELESILGADAVLASNTSSIRIAAIAAGCEGKARIAGMHFFNPVPLMRLVEVIRAPDTSDDAVAALMTLGKRMGRVPVEVNDGPGFLVNLGGRAFYIEALRLVHERIATPGTIDAVMRDNWGYRMGPFELMDLTGMDVNFPASQVIYAGYFHDRRFASAPLHESLLASGRLGRKTGQGHYRYDEAGKKDDGGDDGNLAVEAAPADKVVLLEGDPELSGVLEALLREAGAEILAEDDGASPLAVAVLGEDCTAVAVRSGADVRRLVAVDMMGDISRRITLMTAPGADLAVRDTLAARLAQSGAAISAIHDSPGFVGQRISAAVANLGAEMAQIGTASPDDIDTAMTLGLNYPRGPLALAEHMRPRNVLAILGGLQAATGEERYRPSQWLRRRALLDLPMATAD